MASPALVVSQHWRKIRKSFEDSNINWVALVEEGLKVMWPCGEKVFGCWDTVGTLQTALMDPWQRRMCITICTHRVSSVIQRAHLAETLATAEGALADPGSERRTLLALYFVHRSDCSSGEFSSIQSYYYFIIAARPSVSHSGELTSQWIPPELVQGPWMLPVEVGVFSNVMCPSVFSIHRE